MKNGEVVLVSYIKNIIKVFCVALSLIVLGVSVYFILDSYKSGADIYSYPNLRNFDVLTPGFALCYAIFVLAIVVLIFACLTKSNAAFITEFVLFMVLCVVFLFATFLLSPFLNFESYTEDIDNYLQTDSSTLNEELSGFFPDKETVARYDDNNVKLEYEYWFYYIPFANAVSNEHRTTLKMDFSSNPELFEEHKNSVIPENEHEVVTDGEVTTIVIKDEELIVQDDDKVTYLYNIVIDSETLTVTYFAKKQVDVILDD